MKHLHFILTASIVLSLAFIWPDKNIRIDGVISVDEWINAKEHTLTGGGKFLLKKDGNDLYVGMIAGKKAWAHVYLSHGDTIRVLHASAALGEARYVKQNNLWRNIQPFSWELRERVYNDDLAKKQDDYYRRTGWVANNNNTGDGMSFEFKLDLSRTDNPANLACLVSEIPMDIHYFPAGLNDNTILQRLVQGYTPDSLQFDTKSWEKIQ